MLLKETISVMYAVFIGLVVLATMLVAKALSSYGLLAQWAGGASTVIFCMIAFNYSIPLQRRLVRFLMSKDQA
jgi:hypothetical protein